MDEEVIASPGGPDDPERVTIPMKILFSSVFENAKAENLPMPYVLTLFDAKDQPILSITLMRKANLKLDFVIQELGPPDDPVPYPLAIDLEAADGRSLHGYVYKSGEIHMQ